MPGGPSGAKRGATAWSVDDFKGGFLVELKRRIISVRRPTQAYLKHRPVGNTHLREYQDVSQLSRCRQSCFYYIPSMQVADRCHPNRTRWRGIGPLGISNAVGCSRGSGERWSADRHMLARRTGHWSNDGKRVPNLVSSGEAVGPSNDDAFKFPNFSLPDPLVGTDGG